MKKTLLIILGLVVIVGGYLMMSYNGLITANEELDNKWAQVESQYQRRFDLIPNLVNSVKGAMAQEQTVFQAIADARTKYGGATTPNAKAQAATGVETALGRLLVVMENYPQLKSIDTVTTLMAEITGTENRISTERMRYNDSAKNYNLLIKKFPGNIVASIFGFSVRNYFEATQGSEKAPEVKF